MILENACGNQNNPAPDGCSAFIGFVKFGYTYQEKRERNLPLTRKKCEDSLNVQWNGRTKNLLLVITR